MTDELFTALSHEEKVKWIYFNGELVTSIRYYEYKVNLYLIDRILVEVFYHHLKDCVEKIEPLDRKSKRMKFYTDQVRLPKFL